MTATKLTGLHFVKLHLAHRDLSAVIGVLSLLDLSTAQKSLQALSKDHKRVAKLLDAVRDLDRAVRDVLTVELT